MSRMILLASSVLLATAFSTQVFAAEGKFDQQSCYAGPIHLMSNTPTESCLDRTPLWG